jgi:GTP-binding protein HflX
VKAFRATLEEVTEAELVLHVVDASSPAAEDYVAHVFTVLAEIGAAEIPQILVMNKLDRLPGGDANTEALRRRLLGSHHADGRAVAVSALDGTGIDRLVEAIDQALPLDPVVRTIFRIPAGDGATLAELHRRGKVLATRYLGDVCEVDAEAPESLRRRLERVQ